MDLKPHIRYGLEKARWFTSSLLDALQTDDDWFAQAAPNTNHALWITAHLALADNMFLSQFRQEAASKPDNYDSMFWLGSELQERDAYPDRSEVRAYFDDRRRALMQVVDEVTEEELSAPGPPEDAPSPVAGAPNKGHLLIFAARHEAIHSGQLTVIRRSLGHEPLIKPRT